MGRKPKYTKHAEKVLTMPEGTELFPNIVKQLPQCASPNVELMTSASSEGEKSAQLSLRRKVVKYGKVGIRRSQRIQNTIVAAQSQDIEPVIEDIADSDSDSDREEEQHGSEEVEDDQHAYEEVKFPEQHASDKEEQLPETSFVEKTMEDKIDFIVKLLEAQEKNTEETVKFKVKKSSLSNKGEDLWYKTLYIDSQKKIETLKKENNELVLKLQNALGKLEAYEKGIPGLSEFQNLKDIIFIQHLTKATEATVNGSPQAVHSAPSQDAVCKSVTTAKRKKAS